MDGGTVVITTRATILAQLPTWKDKHAKDFAEQKTVSAQPGPARLTTPQ